MENVTLDNLLMSELDGQSICLRCEMVPTIIPIFNERPINTVWKTLNFLLYWNALLMNC